jgi:outer membrane protein assembly factor BamB
LGRGTIATKLSKEGDTIVAAGLWTNMDNSPKFCSPVLKDGFLYGLAAGGKFYCIDATTGKTAWTEANGSRGDFGSIVDAGSVLIALTPQSELIVFQPSDKEFNEVASLKVADTPALAFGQSSVCGGPGFGRAADAGVNIYEVWAENEFGDAGVEVGDFLHCLPGFGKIE